ncbi:LacI family DNA-binding transcriptional regulator [Paraliobacillus sp. JSM ZJ581]|uniref:LacI family DNA-binding transcriptional regulator n=1 Tax=Paraliobacillus sp. JSM ZJ581 TaxID=3342118 RepID=UPI0035A92E04
MTTIRDVAKYAQVSVATVSRVLNKKGSVQPATKVKVEKAIEALDYKPNDVARSLFKGKSKMIALLVPDITNPFFPELARAVEDLCNQNSYTFILCNTDNSYGKEITYLNSLQQKSIDGMIIVSDTISPDYLAKLKVPIVLLDRVFDKEDYSYVKVNNREGAHEATNYLKQIGCKKIAHIAGPSSVLNAKNRRQGYLDAVAHESWFSNDLIITSDYDMKPQASTEDIKTLLQKHPDIDGIFTANDTIAIRTMKAAEEMQIKIPDDLSIIGFDGISLGEITSPSLTTMAQPIYEMGRKAASMIMDEINDPSLPKRVEKLEVTFMERQSTRKKG